MRLKGAKGVLTSKDEVVGRGLQGAQSKAITLGSPSNNTDVPEARRHDDPHGQHSRNAYQNALTHRTL